MNIISSPLKAIRKNCLDCATTCGEVRHCIISNCPLYPFRFGFNPYNKNAGARLMGILQKAKIETLKKCPDLEKDKFYPGIDVSDLN